MFSLKMKKDLVGIDIGSSSIKLVQLKETKAGYQLEKLGMVPLPAEAIVDNTLMDTSAIVEAVRHLIRTLDIKVTQAACSISGNSVIIRKIGFPVMPADELEEQIHWEAEQYIPFDINDVNIDFHILGPDEFDPAKMNVLLVASKKDIINDYVAVFNEAGIALTVLDVDCFALQNAFEINYEPSFDDIIALVNIGSNIMNLNIIRGGVSLFTRDVQLGGNLFTEELQKKLAIKGDEAEKLKISAGDSGDETVQSIIQQVNEVLAMELYRSVDFYNANAGEEKITKMYVSGGCCKTSFLLEAIQRRLNVPVEIINPFQKILCPNSQFVPEYLKDVGPHVTVAVGLAMRRYADK
jgi:type IV pilus assembly protein PilM